MRRIGALVALWLAVAPAASDNRDLTGVWIGPYTPNLARGITLPYQPGAEERFKNHRGEDDPTARCLPPGVPRALGSPFPIEILQDASSVTILYEYMHLIRRIPTDGRAHPADVEPTFMGDSVGKWEGDTLVVDAIGFNDKTWVDTEGHQHSDALHVVEKYRRTGPDSIAYEVTIDDPKTYKQPWTASRTLTRHADWKLTEYVCEENNKIKDGQDGQDGSRTQKIAFARVFPAPGGVQLFIANRDGSSERPLLASADTDYNPVWSRDGSSIVFTSDRSGQAELYRVRPDGSNVERLTDNPAYDDQAAFSPDGKQLAFVTTRAGGTADIWILDLATKKARALTSGPGGDFRPSWSPDGKWIAFASDRESNLPFARGRWEPQQLVDLYVVHPDGSELKRITPHGDFCGSPKFTGDSRHVVAYCMTAEQTLANRRPFPEPGNDTRLTTISIDGTTVLPSIAAAAVTPDGVKMNPTPFAGGEIGYIRKDTRGTGAGIYYTKSGPGPKGDIRSASWSPDGSRVVFHKRVATAAMPTWKPMWSRNPKYEMTLTGILPAFSPSGDRFVYTTRPTAGTVLGASLAIAKTGVDKADIIYKDEKRNVLAPQWSPGGDRIIFGVGVFNLFFNGFNGLLLKAGDRTEGGAQIAVINPDGSGYREVTSGPSNSAFPSFAPDGRRFVYRSFGPDGEGLRIMDIETKQVTTLTNGYDNFPLWSPRGDVIMFSRLDKGDYEIYTIKPDGTDTRQLTHSHGNDAHQAWSPDGEHIVFASARMGFKDEVVYTDAPQPYGELFVMRYDGSDVQQLTDNQWEEGTPAWQPSVALPATEGKPAAAIHASPVTVLASGGFRAALNELLPQIEATLGVKVTMLMGPSQGSGPDTIGAQLRRGVHADMVIMSREGLDDLIAEKRIAPGTVVDLAQTPLGVAVRSGSPKPDISTVDAFKQTLLHAKAITFRSSTTGIYLTTKLFPRLGIAEAMAKKSTTEGVSAVARGDADLSIQPISELLPQAGAVVVGPVPKEIQYVSTFSSAALSGALDPDVCRRLIGFLASERAEEAIKRAGMTRAAMRGR